MPFFSYVPIGVIAFFVPYINTECLKRLLQGTIIVMSLTAGSYLAVYIGEPYMLHRAKRVHFPGQIMADIITREWRQFAHQPLLFVVGELWEGGNVCFYSSDRPSLLLDGNLRISPWIRLAEVQKAGGVIVWLKRDYTGIPERYAQLFPNAILQPPLKIAYQTQAPLEPVEIGWAIIPPRQEGGDHSEI